MRIISKKLNFCLLQRSCLKIFGELQKTLRKMILIFIVLKNTDGNHSSMDQNQNFNLKQKESLTCDVLSAAFLLTEASTVLFVWFSEESKKKKEPFLKASTRCERWVALYITIHVIFSNFFGGVYQYVTFICKWTLIDHCYNIF